MSQEKIIYALYDDDHNILEAVKKIRSAGHQIHDVYIAFHIH